jgi:hypothetical protein
VPDHVLSPVHGLLEWCEWLVPVDTGYPLYIFAVTVTSYTALLTAGNREDSFFPQCSVVCDTDRLNVLSEFIYCKCVKKLHFKEKKKGGK